MINRRRFFKTVGAGILAAPFVMGKKASFTLGIGTYTYRGVSEDKMIEDLSALRIHQIELSSPDYFLPATKLQNIPILKSKLSGARINVVSFFCGDIKTEADIDLTVRAARGLEARHVSGSAVGDALKLVDQRFKREGLRFGIHNHWFRGRKFEFESPEDLLAALRGVSDAVGVTMDTGHMASCGHDPVDALVKLRDRVQLVHLKDVERTGDDKNVPLGTGIAKSAPVIEKLEQQGFSGLVAIEYEADEDNPQPAVARDVAFARNLI
jgi:sugar phosphate isomerase/epimerase